jgi:putative oxidoreductase
MLAMNTQSIYRIGVVLYALVIGFFGVNHFLNGTGFQNTIPSFIPYHIFWVYLTGVALIAAAISFLTGKYTRAAGLFLALYLLVIVLTIHLPALMRTEGNPIISIALTNLVKDTGLAGAALMIAGKGSHA